MVDEPGRLEATCTAAPPDGLGRRWRATRPTCAPTPPPRSVCSSAWRWSASPARPWLDPAVALVIAGAIVESTRPAGSSPPRRASWSTRRCAEDESCTRSASAVEVLRLAVGVALGWACRGKLRTREREQRGDQVDLHVQWLLSGIRLEQPHERSPYELQDAIATSMTRRRRAEPPRAFEGTRALRLVSEALVSGAELPVGRQRPSGQLRDAGQRRLIAADSATATSTPAYPFIPRAGAAARR